MREVGLLGARVKIIASTAHLLVVEPAQYYEVLYCDWLHIVSLLDS